MKVGKVEFVTQIMEMQKERRHRKSFREYVADCEVKDYCIKRRNRLKK